LEEIHVLVQTLMAGSMYICVITTDSWDSGLSWCCVAVKRQ